MVNIIETDNEVLVSFPYDPVLVNKAKSVYPYKWDKNSKIWRYSTHLRESVYYTFGQICPPKPYKSTFTVEEKPSSFLLKHQKIGLDMARRHAKYAFYFDTGTGKTILAGEILKHKRGKSLIVAPLSILKSVWEKSINEFYPELSFETINLYNLKKEDREKVIRGYNGIHIINYEGFKQQYENILTAGYKCLITDESSKLKGRTTQIAKALVSFGQKIESAYLLSGTPAPNTPLEYYSQLDLVAPGLLGYSFYAFRNRYFHSVDRNGFIWVEKKNMTSEFVERLKKVCMFVKKNDVLDLPDRVFITKEVEMTGDQLRIYKQMKKDFIAEIGEVMVISPTMLSKIMRLRQITSGFIYHRDGSVRFSTAKLDVLKETLEEIGDNQVIIWAVFREEIQRLLEAIPGSRAVYGEMPSQEEKNRNKEDFIRGDYQYLIANPKSLGIGETFINSSYAVYYSLDYSNEGYTQSADRIYRYGQKNQCTYIHLLCQDSIDEIIYKVLQRKIKGTQEILEHLKQ